MKQLYFIIFLLFTCSMEKCFAIGENCLTLQWESNAKTLTDDTNLNQPRDLYADQNNVVYVLDSGYGRVRRIWPNSTVERTFINAMTGPVFNQSSYILGIQGDTNGNLYILDVKLGRVVKWSTANMNGTVVAGGYGNGYGANQLNAPCGMFFDPNTMFIWIADTYNHRIVRWESPTTGIIVGGSNGSNADQFNYPFGLFVDTKDANTLYVADTYNHRIQQWLSGAKNGTTVAGQTGVAGSSLSVLYYPISVIGDGNKNLYILCFTTSSIVKWQVGATVGSLIVGTLTAGSSSNQLYNPYNFKFGPDYSIYVPDFKNNRTQKFSAICSNVTSTTIITTRLTTASSTIRTIVSSSTTRLSSSTSIPRSSATTTSAQMPSAAADHNLQWLLMIVSLIVAMMNN
ncbi:unnamed protein product [Adineta ricciae]|uniref:NHL repeat containing protein-like protein n=2 Tax=Adineta ricciae TaxID=249248 RepID=A0A815DZJ4_ADIRI|nr:unnamed protein product [Adineta ricciae]